MKPCLLFLSCKNINEADKISYKLLSEKLIVCAKKLPINSSFLWKNKIESSQEVLLIMDSVEENFNKINKEVKKIHSYQIYNLVMTKANKINNKSLKW
ncbi:MAG: hypothetical protein ACD_12C00093G0001, partial [uncultured bacterium]